MEFNFKQVVLVAVFKKKKKILVGLLQCKVVHADFPCLSVRLSPSVLSTSVRDHAV